MKIVRTIGLLLLLSFTSGFAVPAGTGFGGAGGLGDGAATCVALLAEPATLRVSYDASCEQTWNAYIGVLKEMGYKIVDEESSPECKQILLIPYSQKRGRIAAEYTSNEILGVKISINERVKEPTPWTKVNIISPVSFSEIAKKRRALIHQKVLERLKAKPEC
jgi:hypothetical protein